MMRVVERKMRSLLLPAVLLPLVPWLLLRQSPFESARAQTSIQESARVVLERSCLHCHGDENNSGLDMRRRENLLRGGPRGPAVVPGRPEASVLYLAAAHDDGTDLEMPFGGDRLAEEDLAVLEAWIRAGAPWNDLEAAEYQAPSWWSFKPPTHPDDPRVEETAWIANSIDTFVLAKLEEQGLPHAPAADRGTLIRRAYFDLIGLPPTPAEVESFVDDSAEDAYRKLITKLLASPHYGERWGRHWLDVVRYADSTGFESDEYFPYAWRYRDYVIKSFNEDKPYDRFVQEQIAADEIWPDDLDTQGGYSIPPRKLRHLEARVGTGLYTFGPIVGESKMNDKTLTSENLTDWVNVTGAAFMGATLACARCHDHKFDPISQKDYYRMQAIFAGSHTVDIPLSSRMASFWRNYWHPKLIDLDAKRKGYKSFVSQIKDRATAAKKKGFAAEVVEAYEVVKPTAEQAKRAAPLKKAIDDMDLEQYMSAEELEERDALKNLLLNALVNLPEKEPANEVFYEALFDNPTARVLEHRQPELVPDIHVLERGQLTNPMERVDPGIPVALDDGAISFETQSDSVPHVPRSRQKLAYWLSRPDHPLTARVMVNRIWQFHFGQGLLPTPNDLGRTGEAPTHPQLLDWLATEFSRRGWSMKAMHWLIMTSNTYKMASRFTSAEAVETDPGNRFLWRMNRRRIEGEVLWDTVHSVAGTLDLKMGGRPVMPSLSEEELSSLTDNGFWLAADASGPPRRGIYILNRRGFQFPLFAKFDHPENALSCPRRDVTTVAPQALWLMNNRTAYHQAEQFATRLVEEKGDDSGARVARAWKLALGRGPTAEEAEEALALLDELAGGAAGTNGDELGLQALTELCLAVFNLNEFVYID